MNDASGRTGLVIGLTGSNASGKGEAAAHLRGRGFVYHSLSDVVRDEAARRGFPPEREHLIRIGNELRRERGPGALAEMIVPRLSGRDIVDSVRNPAEVEALRRLPHFVLLGLSASADVRFRRSLARARPGDPRTLEAFIGRERQENTADPRAQQLDRTFRMADHVVENEGELEALRTALDRLLDRIEADIGRADQADAGGPVDPSGASPIQ